MSFAAGTTISTLDGTSEKRIMMEMEIQFSKGRTDRVLVHYDDDPLKIATEFVNRNRLKESAVPAISKHIKTTIDNFLSSKKILNDNKQLSPKIKEKIDAPDEEVKGNSIESSSLYTQETSTVGYIDKKVQEIDNIKFINQSINPSTSTTKLPVEILSTHMNTNSSSNINPKQYQENIDRNMNIDSFSYNKIATELVISSQSISPEINKKMNIKETNNFESDLSFEQKLFSKRSSSLIMSTTNNATTNNSNKTNKYASNNNNHHNSRYSPINTPVPKNNNSMVYPAFNHSQIQKELNDIDDDDDISDSYPTLSNHPKLSKEYNEEEDMESVSEIACTEDGDDIKNSLNYDHENFDKKVDNYLEEFNPEAMYNRIRQSFYQHQPASITSASKSISTKNSSLKYKQHSSPPSIALLKPSSTTMQLTTTLQSKAIQQHSMVGKNTNERLYIAAKMKKDKIERTSKQKEVEFEKKLLDEKFKVNKNSAKIVEMIRPRQQQNSIHERLHDDGIIEKQLKVKRADELKDILQHQEWSCAKCGTFHSISRAEVVIQPLHQMKSRAKNNVMIDNQHHNQPSVEICKQCGWNQTHVEPFKPINIGLTLSENITGSNIELNDLALDKRWTGKEDSNNSSNNIHEYLYANARTRENISQLNRVLFEESNPDLTFTPRIPETSKEIIEKYKSQSVDNSGGDVVVDNDHSLNSYLNSFEQNINTNHRISGTTTISTYLSIPAVERLATTKTLSNNIQMLNSMNSFSQFHQEQSTNEHFKTSKDREEFTNRLVYEYKSKHNRIEKLSEMYYKYDYITGRPLFQPKIGPNPDEALGYRNRNIGLDYTNNNDNNKSIDIFTKIIHKDEELKQKRKYAEDQAIKKELKDLEGMKIKPLHNSMNIIHQSNQRNAKELFDLLLHTQMNIFEKNNYKIDGRDIEINIKDCHNVLFLDYVNTEIMLDHVCVLLQNILYEKIKKDIVMNTYPYNGVTFEDFKTLALICVHYKDGPGKGYICAPKKIPELAIQMSQQKQAEITFHPIIDKYSADICYNRYNKDLNNGLRVEDTLHLEGEKLKLKHKDKQQELLLKENKELTFQPNFYKVPSYIKPKYRGMEVLDNDADNNNNEINNEMEEVIDNNQKNMNKKLFNTLTSTITNVTKQTNSKHNTLIKTNNKLSVQNKMNNKNKVNNQTTTINKMNNKMNNKANNNSSIASVSPTKSDDDLTINTISTKFSTINNNNNDNNNRSLKDGNSKINENILLNKHNQKINNNHSTTHSISSNHKSLPLLPHEIQKLQINDNNNVIHTKDKNIELITNSPKNNLRLSSVTAISNNSSNTIIKDK